MLHIVNKSPFKFRNLDSCIRIAKDDDPIMLIEDGVYAALPGTTLDRMMKEALKTHPVFAIQADLKARGVDRIIEGIQVCDYSCFVTLVEKHVPYSWL